MNQVESNPQWYRVAGLHIELRDHIRIHRHVYRGKPWYVITDTITNKHYRFSKQAYQFIRNLNGKTSVEKITQQLNNIDNPPGQDEIISLLASLHQNDLIRSNITPDTAELFNRYQKSRTKSLQKYVKGPLLIRVPFIDPNNYLNRFKQLASHLFSRFVFTIWLLVTTTAVVLSLSNWGEISGYWNSRLYAPDNLLLLVLIYPLIKAMHELAHALAVKRWGGEVHEIGIMFFIFMPLPYVDASSASIFSDKRKRIIVSAAGILTELFLAAIASFVWLSVETGIVRDIAYNVMLIGGISTLLFNGNPLLRFDGYYILSDLIEIPNLAQRSTKYYSYLAQKFLFKLKAIRSPIHEKGERPWLLFYGLASTLYRLILLTTIALFLFEQYLLFGLILAVLAIYLQVVLPLWRQFQFVFTSPIIKHQRFRALLVSFALPIFIVVGLFVVPIPSSTYTQGVVWLPEKAQLRASVDGFVGRVLHKPHSEVEAGTALIETENALLQLNVERLTWELEELKARLNQKVASDRADAEMLKIKIAQLTQELNDAQAKVSDLTIISPSEGTFLFPNAHHSIGRYVKQGEVVGYVTNLTQPTVRAVVEQNDIALVREQTKSVKIRLADNSGKTHNAKIIRQIPSATSSLPDKSLGSLGGGQITVNSNDSTGMTALEELFWIDIALPADLSVQRVGTRAHIRFEHESQAIATRLFREIRQLFLQRFTL